MNLEQARFNMIEQQIRPWNVLDLAVLGRLHSLKREEFVPEAMRGLAFVDMELPLGEGQVMLQPKVEARIVQDLALKTTDKVLQIGTGSGYLTALLASFSQYVYSIDINPAFKAAAEAKLFANGVKNVSLLIGDGAKGLEAKGPFDVIVVTASLPVVPDTLKHQLTVGGRLFAIVGDAPVMSATIITRLGPDTFSARKTFETCTAPLINAAQPERFVF